MAYETRTASAILDEMKVVVRDDVDKREGSVVHDMLAPPAEQIEMLDFELAAIYLNGFADTADLPYLIRRAAEMGVDWKDAVKAQGVVTITGTDGLLVPAGFRVYTDAGVYFQTIADATLSGGTATVAVEAVEGGIAGNIGPAEITQYENTVAGVTDVTNAEVFTGGIDAETKESLLARYLLKVRKPITSGNVYHYEKWATDVDGVATAKVFPLHAGAGTVKVVVVAANGRAPTPDIIANVAEHIEAERPIGATVTVVPVVEVAINISAKLTLAGDLLPVDVLDAIKTSVGAYLLTAAQSGIVRYARVGEALLEVNGVLDYELLTINDATANVPIAEDAVAVVGEVVLT
ncbi:baseplate J/gp47 family protein [Cytobacillus massiliigabonensis]|uniref:baseplate J/gp47 family protein n=1 Tax=Cytobacillus massiliigabonensis TaxID=1871011 RepID=UPI000C81E9ED|nr:baseplate J/gp47 family protein [Cytobacillus massiliigabonensis]